MVFALGRIVPDPELGLALFATEFLRTLPAPVPAVVVVLSRLPLFGRDDGVVVMCNFC